jgi:hypothetical protein
VKNKENSKIAEAGLRRSGNMESLLPRMSPTVPQQRFYPR